MAGLACAAAGAAGLAVAGAAGLACGPSATGLGAGVCAVPTIVKNSNANKTLMTRMNVPPLDRVQTFHHAQFGAAPIIAGSAPLSTEVSLKALPQTHHCARLEDTPDRSYSTTAVQHYGVHRSERLGFSR